MDSEEIKIHAIAFAEFISSYKLKEVFHSLSPKAKETVYKHFLNQNKDE